MEQNPCMVGDPNKVEIPVNSPTFLKQNEGPSTQQLEVSGIEMMVVQRVSYTSLRDIMPHPNNASWNEIPIKNPLLKQAALAYLQPLSTPPEVGNKTFLQKLREKCFYTAQDFGCFRWLSCVAFNTLLGSFIGLFCDRRRTQNEDQQHEDNDDAVEDEGRDGSAFWNFRFDQ